MLAWVIMGLALWHYTIFLPDRFWGGIVGAFLASIAGAIVTGVVISAAVHGHRDPRPPRDRRRRPSSTRSPARCSAMAADLLDRRAARERAADGSSAAADRACSRPQRAFRRTRRVGSRAMPEPRAAPRDPAARARDGRARSSASSASAACSRRCSRGAGSPTRRRRASSSTRPTAHRPGDVPRASARRSSWCSATSRAARAITVHGDYDCDGVCSTAILVVGAARAGRRRRLVPARSPGRRLRARRRDRRAARRARHGAADHRRLRDHRRRGGRAGARARARRARHRPPQPARGRRAARTRRTCTRRSAAIPARAVRDRGRGEARAGAARARRPRRRRARRASSSSSRSRPSPTSWRCAARTAGSCAPGCARSRRRRGPGCAR